MVQTLTVTTESVMTHHCVDSTLYISDFPLREIKRETHCAHSCNCRNSLKAEQVSWTRFTPVIDK